MVKRNTKELILIEALKLFSINGYEGVTVRDIAGEIGIRQSSLYKHYSSKQDIFNSIVNTMKDNYNKMCMESFMPQGEVTDVARQYEKISFDAVKDISKKMFFYWTEDEYAKSFRKMLVIEQYKSEEMSKLYNEYFIDGPVNYISQIFKIMIEEKYFINTDPYYLATEFYAPMLLLMSRYNNNTKREDIDKILENHLYNFSRCFGGD